MRLKQLTLSGFKSFADKTVIRFDKGVTAVVGPNGCGKSNIVDAVRWVFGEQSAKSMRGSKMYDVLFAGTETRKAINVAEVTIVFADVGDALPIEYDEVSVTRRLFRTGDSEYLINGTLVRLKDVHGLFWDSGMGKSAFSIFEQGKIEQVINLSPIDRRTIFEEAAGILRFKQNKKEALRRLDDVKDNASRIHDIYVEVKKQVSVLEKQAKAARNYKDHKARAELLDRELITARWGSAKVRHARFLSEYAAVEEAFVKGGEVMTEVEGDLEKARSSMVEIEKKAAVALEQLFAARSNKKIHVAALKSDGERIEELALRRERVSAALSESSEDGNALIVSAENECCLLQKTCVAAEKRSKELAEQGLAFEASLKELRDTQKKCIQQQHAILTAEKEIASKVQKNALRFEAVEERICAMTKQKEDLFENAKHQRVMSSEHEKQVGEQRNLIDSKKKTLDDVKRDLAEVVESLRRAEKALDSVGKERAKIVARKDALEQMQRDMDGFSSDAKRLLEAAADEESVLYGIISTVYEHIVPHKGYAHAVAASMRQYAHTLVVSTERDLVTLMAFARDNEIRDFSVLCVEHINSGKKKAISLKEGSKLSENVEKGAITSHFLQNVVVVEELADALRIKKEQTTTLTVTADGAFCDMNSVTFCGVPCSMTFLRRAEIDLLDSQILDSTSEEERLASSVASLDKKRTALHRQRDDADREMRRQEMTLIELNHTLQRAIADLARVESVLKSNENELRTLFDEKRSLEKSSLALDETYKAIQEKSVVANKEVLVLEERMEILFSDYQKMRDEQRIHEIEYKKASEQYHTAVRERMRREDREKERRRQRDHATRELADIEKRYALFMEKKEERELAYAEIEKTIERAEKLCVGLGNDVEETKQGLAIIEKRREMLLVRRKDKEEHKRQLALKSAQGEGVIRLLEEEALQRYGMPLADLEVSGLEGSIDDAEKELRGLRRFIEDAGDINMTSIEEYEKLNERESYLSRQLSDLSSSQKDIGKVIAKLDRESRKRFNETFEIIRENFKKNFQRLFNGGEADLQFTESADILDAGIEILAKPPGKNVRSIALMSGGEKCLTALALLFSVFEYRPSPFCILDEIDAPLDDANVTRFLNVVKYFVETTQFLIVTHNKNTMSVADALCGVSMEEKGVTKLIPLYIGGTQSIPSKIRSQQQDAMAVF